MNLTITDINDTRKDVVVTISGEEIAAEEQRILKEFSKQARIPGFRPGKAPEARIRAKFAKQIAEELKGKLVRAAFDTVAKDDSVELYRIVDLPEVDDFTAGQEANIDMTVDVLPTFDVPEYKGIKTRVPSSNVDDSEVETAIERVRGQHADFIVVEREAAVGDYVKLSYSGMIGEDKLAEKLGEAQNLRAWGDVTDGWEEAGTEQAKQYGVPAIIDAAVGMKAGDSKDVEAVLPESFPIEELRGQTAKYTLAVGEVRERKLPELDDADFLKAVRAESVEELKANVLDELERTKKREVEGAKRQQILDHLSSVVNISLPESAVEEETQNTMARIIGRNMDQGVPEEAFEANKDQIHQNASETAKREVKLQIILNRIAKEEKVEVTNEDLSRAVYGMAMQQRQRPEDLAKELRKDRSKVVQLQRQLMFAKALDKIVEAAEVEEVAAASEENTQS